jgi:uncharacterized membrane protein (UPF0127 family)
MRILVGFLVLSSLVIAFGVGCGGGDSDVPSNDTPVVVLRPGGRPEVRVRVELPRTPAERARGLMFREQLEPDAGMLFIYEEEENLTFWMKNTLIPLDMIFISKDFRVVGIVENAEPQTETSRRIDQPAQFVLEVNGGFAATNGVGPGTEVEFVGIDRDGAGQ